MNKKTIEQGSRYMCSNCDGYLYCLESERISITSIIATLVITERIRMTEWAAEEVLRIWLG